MIAAIVMAAALSGEGSADLANLGWMVGTWSETKGEVVTRETWQAPVDGVMSGVGETVRPGKPASVERMKITVEPAGITFTALLAGQPPTPFVILPGKPGEAVFQNQAHDFPQRVIYRRCGVQLCARIEGTLGGKLEAQEWRYTRSK